MILEYPLIKANRLRLARAFAHHQRVDIGIDCAVEGQMGRAYADDGGTPAVFRIEQGPFQYLAGDARSAAGREMMKTLPSYTLLMPSPPEWAEVGREIHGDRLFSFPRYSFSSEHLSLEHLHRLLDGSRFRDAIQPVDASLAARLQGGEQGFLDISAFESAQDFEARGIGFCVMAGGTLLGVAYSSLVCSKGIEVSIVVSERHRRRGMATALACVLLKHCLQHDVKPHWDAANRPSCGLAEKLGYVPNGTYQAHYLAE